MTDAFRNPQVPYTQPKPPRPKPSKPKAPKAPGFVGIPKAAPVTPTSTAMGAFRTALAQLQASTPQVDAGAIRAPYVASEQVTGQLGAGYQAAEQQAAQAAQAQYAQAQQQAQGHAAAFGISAGAGANPTALSDNGTAQLAQQGQAYTAAAPAATAQWQALLERTAGAKVSDAQLQRSQGLTAAQQSLATSLPGAIGNEEDRAFQRHTQSFNERLAESQLTDKEAADLRQYGIDVGKLKLQGQQFDTTTDINRGKLKVQQDTLKLKQRAASIQKTGLKGVPGAVSALTAAATAKPPKAGSTTKVARGWDVQVVSYDPESDATGTKITTVQVPDKRHAPAGFKIVAGTTAKPHYDTVPARTGQTGALGVTKSLWDAQFRSLMAQNQDVPNAAAQIKRLLGPRPKK